MGGSLSESQADLVLSIVRKRAPEMIATVLKLSGLTREQRLRLCDVLADELSATGLTPNDEISGRGELIEDLIDALKPRHGD